MSGNGWRAHAKSTHPNHEDYAKKTLYAYMPCYGRYGIEYVDAVVKVHYQGSYAFALRDFVYDAGNQWCPRWIQRNYQIQNREAPDAVAPYGYSNLGPEDVEGIVDGDAVAVPKEQAASTGAPQERFPHERVSPQKFVFEPEGEPLKDQEEEHAEAQCPEHNWQPESRKPWQLHSERGPNVDAVGTDIPKPAVPFEDIVNPEDLAQAYDRHWKTYSPSRTYETWEKIKQGGTKYSDESLTKENLGDDYQQIFVTMVLDHVEHVLDCVRRREQPEPLRLLLLGIAGSGKTRAIQTLLQEIQRALAQANLPAEIDPEAFVRVGAPTGTAAFNVRFNATTIHRLIHWFTPPYFSRLTNADQLHRLQQHLMNTHLVIIDEISMVGRQVMGRMDDSPNQGRAGQNEAGHSLGGVCCVGVGDPA